MTRHRLFPNPLPQTPRSVRQNYDTSRSPLIRLRYAIAEGISVDGSEQHLYQVMDVLLDNALKYSTPGSMVSVDHSDDAAAAVVTLSTDEKMSVTISVDEADILSLELGQTYYYAYYDTLEISFTPDFGGGGNRRPTN